MEEDLSWLDTECVNYCCGYLDARLNKQFDITLVDISSMYSLRPSQYRIGGKTVLEALGVTSCSNIDMLDSTIMSSYINFVMIEDVTSPLQVNYADMLMSFIKEKSTIELVADSDTIDHHTMGIYAKAVWMAVKSLTRCYTDGYVGVSDVLKLEELKQHPKIYIASSVSIYFDNEKSHMSLEIKRVRPNDDHNKNND